MPKASRVFLELVGYTALVTLLAWAPLYFVIFVDRGCGPNEIPAPPLLQLKKLYQSGPWVLLASLVVFALLAWKSALPALSGRSTRRKVVVIGGALAVQAVLVFGLIAGQLALDPHWLFGHTVPTLSKVSPDGKRTAHASHGCFLGCTWNVYVQEQGALKMTRLFFEGAGKDETTDGATLEWAPDGADVKLNRRLPRGVSR
jgi:hypothetical protein